MSSVVLWGRCSSDWNYGRWSNNHILGWNQMKEISQNVHNGRPCFWSHDMIKVQSELQTRMIVFVQQLESSKIKEIRWQDNLSFLLTWPFWNKFNMMLFPLTVPIEIVRCSADDSSGLIDRRESMFFLPLDFGILHTDGCSYRTDLVI